MYTKNGKQDFLLIDSSHKWAYWWMGGWGDWGIHFTCVYDWVKCGYAFTITIVLQPHRLFVSICVADDFIIKVKIILEIIFISNYENDIFKNINQQRPARLLWPILVLKRDVGVIL
jgi:hypothetical protein